VSDSRVDGDAGPSFLRAEHVGRQDVVIILHRFHLKVTDPRCLGTLVSQDLKTSREELQSSVLGLSQYEQRNTNDLSYHPRTGLVDRHTNQLNRQIVPYTVQCTTL
jgi:hypothetical protein